MFADLRAPPPDKILSLIALHRDDPRPGKIDLGVGVYRSEGRTPIPESVREAERRLHAQEETKAYLGTLGDPGFNAAMTGLVFGADAPRPRIRAMQTPGGSGALSTLAGLFAQARPDPVVWVPTPTWGNHAAILEGAGCRVRSYPYYDAARGGADVGRMLEALSRAAPGEVVLLHGCCHNPTGADPGPEEWAAIVDLLGARGLFPFVDLAYQGFAEGLEADAGPVRRIVAALPEAAVAVSCSKNFGIYRERTGAAFVVAADEGRADVAQAQLAQRARVAYSMPPDHGGALVRIILEDADLAARWRGELEAMRASVARLRGLVADALGRTTDRFSALRAQKGMFSLLGLDEAAVLRLREEYGVYLVEGGRMNVAGLREADIEPFAAAVAAVSRP